LDDNLEIGIKTMKVMENKIAAHYHDFIREIKEKIRTTQYEAAKVVNTSIISLYWDIGSRLSEKIKSGWGKSVVETLSADIQKEFPGIKGFSSTNLWYMKQFFEEYRSSKILQPMVGEISWSKHLVIMGKCKTNWCCHIQAYCYFARRLQGATSIIRRTGKPVGCIFKTNQSIKGKINVSKTIPPKILIRLFITSMRKLWGCN
jgi:predicted nuclease of restriction endonuclease-like (RecB) superfamily